MANCRPENIPIMGNIPSTNRVIDTTPIHLSSCNMIRYKPIPMPPQLDIQRCNNN